MWITNVELQLQVDQDWYYMLETGVRFNVWNWETVRKRKAVEDVRKQFPIILIQDRSVELLVWYRKIVKECVEGEAIIQVTYQRRWILDCVWNGSWQRKELCRDDDKWGLHVVIITEDREHFFFFSLIHRKRTYSTPSTVIYYNLVFVCYVKVFTFFALSVKILDKNERWGRLIDWL